MSEEVRNTAVQLLTFYTDRERQRYKRIDGQTTL